MFYRKHYVPLESNPDVFTQLIHSLGVSSCLAFQDVLAVDEPEMLPRPALALILVFPTSDAYEIQKAKEESLCQDYEGSGEGEDTIWFKQTINNACGLYSILHAVSNGDVRNFIRKLKASSVAFQNACSSETTRTHLLQMSTGSILAKIQQSRIPF